MSNKMSKGLGREFDIQNARGREPN